MTEAVAPKSPIPIAVHLYWRPGCPFCMMLRRGLDKIGIDTIDHNIWSEPADAAVVRSYANGNETVPTVVIGDVGLVNPSASAVAAHLAEFAPHLLPSEDEVPEPGRLQRLLGGG